MTYSLPLAAWAIAIGFTFVSGAVWFGPKTFFPVWWRLMGKRPDEQPGGESMGLVFGLTFLGVVVQTWALGVLLANLPITSAVDGLVVGLIAGVGISAITSLSHRLFGGFGLKVWLVEVGADVLNLAVSGLVFGWFLAS